MSIFRCFCECFKHDKHPTGSVRKLTLFPCARVGICDVTCPTLTASEASLIKNQWHLLKMHVSSLGILTYTR